MENPFLIENGVLLRYDGPGGNVVIPEGVISIGPRAFLSCVTLRSVTIPEGVTEISGDFFSEDPSGAFSGCSALSSVVFPESLREIGCWAFSGCGSLRSLSLPRGLSKIGNRAFHSCAGLKSVTLPVFLREVDYGVFMGCTGLQSVELPENLGIIREYAFAECTSLTRVSLPAGLRTIDFSAFRNCSALPAVVIPEETVQIGEFAFENCENLMSASIGAGVERIGESAFQNCPKLVIRTCAGSAAVEYAESHDIPAVTYEGLKEAAGKMMKAAYAPYSHFPVGAVLECEDGTLFTGCNVENAAYPAGICAERNAIFHAVSEGYTRFSRIAVASKGKDFCVPCGLCRQTMAEFSPDMEVISFNGAGEQRSFFLRDLLPHGFSAGNLETN